MLLYNHVKLFGSISVLSSIFASGVIGVSLCNTLADLNYQMLVIDHMYQMNRIKRQETVHVKDLFR